MKVLWRTDTGKVRTNNEDSIKIDADHAIFLLADGMGGHSAGEIASDLAVNVAYTHISQQIVDAEDENTIFSVLEEALLRAHNAVKEKAGLDIHLYGMGTTLVELYLKNSNAYLCHVGDSRAYLYRKTLHRLTKDHTIGDLWVEQGVMKREQVPPRQWHILMKAVGPGADPVPDKKSVGLKQGDILLLCSDGLTDMLSDSAISKIIEENRDDIDRVVYVLISEANYNGGKDNISVILVMI